MKDRDANLSTDSRVGQDETHMSSVTEIRGEHIRYLKWICFDTSRSGAAASGVAIHRLFGPVLRIVVMLGGVTFILSLLSFFGGLWWCFDLLTHFQVFYLPALAVSLAAALALRARTRIVLLSLGLAITTARIAPLYLDQPASPEGGARLSVASFNIYADNSTPNEAIRYVRDSREDILVLLETETDWAKLVTEKTTGYRIVMSETRHGAFGMIVLAKIPLLSITPMYFERPNVVSAHIRLEFDGRPLSILAVHTPPPGRPEGGSIRDRQYVKIAEWVKQQSEPVIVIGDLNATAWSNPYRKLLDASGLVDSENGFGYQPTWPGTPCSMIPIDRCLHTPEITAVDRFIGEHCGSDHAPLHVRLSWARNEGR